MLGIVDRFAAAGLRCFGPTQGAAQLEGSKAFAKDFLPAITSPPLVTRALPIRCGGSLYPRNGRACRGQRPTVWRPVRRDPGPKRTGSHRRHAGMLSGADFGEAGHRVIEEFLHGEEASFIVMTDGETILPLASSQDHRRSATTATEVPIPAAWGVFACPGGEPETA